MNQEANIVRLECLIDTERKLREALIRGQDKALELAVGDVTKFREKSDTNHIFLDKRVTTVELIISNFQGRVLIMGAVAGLVGGIAGILLTLASKLLTK